MSKSPARAAIESLNVGEEAYIGPYKRQSSVYSAISKFKPEGTDFKVKKLTAIDSEFTTFYKDIYLIERIK